VSETRQHRSLEIENRSANHLCPLSSEQSVNLEICDETLVIARRGKTADPLYEGRLIIATGLSFGSGT